MARIYKMQVTLPYFIPLFLPAFHPGTMGAFIKMRSTVPNKKALFDIGIAGPAAGLIMSVIFLAVGFNRLPDESGIWQYISTIHPLDEPGGVNLILGGNVLFDFLVDFFEAGHLPMNEIYHFPFIFAGWIGLLVTALNLMPIGQLDGGHITYSMFGDKARLIAMFSFVFLIMLNVYLISSFNSYAWILWPVLIFFFIKFRHPPTKDNSIELDLKRKILGWIAYIIFCICFSPIPVYIL
jgi:membrane-associated protease RseP (regulator of RpoE activity)